jgi:hypothetical protein
MSKAYYCSISEAWGDSYEQSKNRYDDLNLGGKTFQSNFDSSMINVNNNSNDEYDKYLSIGNSNNNNINNNNHHSNSSDDFNHCDKIISHIDKCKKCKDNLLNKLKENREYFGNDEYFRNDEYFNSNKSNIEGFDNYGKVNETINVNNDDVIILILLGIFIIFILDSFVRLGKKIQIKIN